MEIVYNHPGVIVGWRAPMLVTCWRTAPALPFASVMCEHFSRLAKESGGGIIFIVITHADHGPPDRVAADMLAKTTRSVEKHILAHGFIIEGKGFKAGAIRASVKTFQTLTRVIFPWTISATVEDGLLWLARKAGFLSEEEARVYIADIETMRSAPPPAA